MLPFSKLFNEISKMYFGRKFFKTHVGNVLIDTNDLTNFKTFTFINMDNAKFSSYVYQKIGSNDSFVVKCNKIQRENSFNENVCKHNSLYYVSNTLIPFRRVRNFYRVVGLYKEDDTL